MARLVGASTAEVQRRRLETARAFALRDGRGRGPEGPAHGGRRAGRRGLAVNPTGNPGMATGGTGDVLAGIVGALLAAGTTPGPAAVAGVYRARPRPATWRPLAWARSRSPRATDRRAVASRSVASRRAEGRSFASGVTAERGRRRQRSRRDLAARLPRRRGRAPLRRAGRGEDRLRARSRARARGAIRRRWRARPSSCSPPTRAADPAPRRPLSARRRRRRARARPRGAARARGACWPSSGRSGCGAALAARPSRAASSTRARTSGAVTIEEAGR